MEMTLSNWILLFIAMILVLILVVGMFVHQAIVDGKKSKDVGLSITFDTVRNAEADYSNRKFETASNLEKPKKPPQITPLELAKKEAREKADKINRQNR